jgi:hypothetical protein
MPLFRVKAGQHIAADPDWQPSEAEIKAQEATGNPPKAPSKATAEQEDAIIDDPSRPPGFKEGNGGKGSDLPKGKRIVEQYGDLEQYTVNDLKSLAESEKIDLAGATRKDEIVKAIKKAK